MRAWVEREQSLSRSMLIVLTCHRRRPSTVCRFNHQRLASVPMHSCELARAQVRVCDLCSFLAVVRGRGEGSRAKMLGLKTKIRCNFNDRTRTRDPTLAYALRYYVSNFTTT